MIFDKQYRRWLSNAFEYYLGDGFVDMSDAEWDVLAHEFAKNSEEYDELRGRNYEGGSLFWLKREEYPDWARL